MSLHHSPDLCNGLTTAGRVQWIPSQMTPLPHSKMLPNQARLKLPQWQIDCEVFHVANGCQEKGGEIWQSLMLALKLVGLSLKLVAYCVALVLAEQAPVDAVKKALQSWCLGLDADIPSLQLGRLTAYHWCHDTSWTLSVPSSSSLMSSSATCHCYHYHHHSHLHLA